MSAFSLVRGWQCHDFIRLLCDHVIFFQATDMLGSGCGAFITFDSSGNQNLYMIMGDMGNGVGSSITFGNYLVSGHSKEKKTPQSNNKKTCESLALCGSSRRVRIRPSPPRIAILSWRCPRKITLKSKPSARHPALDILPCTAADTGERGISRILRLSRGTMHAGSALRC